MMIENGESTVLYPNQLANFNQKHWRRIICQFRETFSDLHRTIEANQSDETGTRYKSEHLNLSELCLNANEKYIKIIENELKTIRDNEEDASTLKESFNLILMVWKLCQIIFIKSSPSGALLIDLQEWYRTTNNIDCMIQELFSVNAKNIANICKDGNYWLVILMAVAQGRIDTARHLLSFHYLKNSSSFKAIDEQLRCMPNLSSLGHFSLFEFKAKWEYWQKKCIQVLTTEDFSMEETGSLEFVCKILCADEKTFVELKPLFNNWYYMLIAYASYSNPTFNITDLHQLIESGTFMKAFDGDFNAFDLTIKSIFDFDITVVIKECNQLFGNHLFSAHLLDILYLNGKLQLNNKHDFEQLVTSSTNNQPDLIHEQHLNDYAVQLLEANGASLAIYQTAIDYLLKCRSSLETKGIEVIEIYMERIPLTNISELDGCKVFNMAYQLGLHDLAFSIGRVMQMRAFKRGMYGTALAWNCRIKDACFGNILGEKIFEEFLETEDTTLLDLTESMTKDIIYSDKLIFLNKYREFYMLLNENSKMTSISRSENLRKAADLIIQLLEAPKLIPFKYRKKILFDLKSLVYENIFSEDQLFTILRVIQTHENQSQVTLFQDNHNNTTKKNNPLLFDKGDDVMVMEEEEIGSSSNKPKQKLSNFEEWPNFDQNKWIEFLSEIGKRVADCFVKNSIDV